MMRLFDRGIVLFWFACFRISSILVCCCLFSFSYIVFSRSLLRLVSWYAGVHVPFGFMGLNILGSISFLGFEGFLSVLGRGLMRFCLSV